MNKLKHFLANLWRFRKILWTYRTWDWAFNVNLFADSLEWLSKDIEQGAEEDRARIRKVNAINELVILLRRMTDEPEYGTIEKLGTKKYPSLAGEMGARIEVVSKMGYTSVLASKAQEYAINNKCFHVRYGFNLIGNLDVFVGSVANQTANIPNEVETIVITCGSAITLIGVLYGLVIYNKTNIKKIYAVGIAPNRLRTIQKYRDMIYVEKGVLLPIEKLKYIDAFNKIKGYKYENTFNEEYKGIQFHPRYEAKAFHWLKQQNKNLKNSLMWITGADI